MDLPLERHHCVCLFPQSESSVQFTPVGVSAPPPASAHRQQQQAVFTACLHLLSHTPPTAGMTYTFTLTHILLYIQYILATE